MSCSAALPAAEKPPSPSWSTANGLIPAFTEDCTLTGQVLLNGAPVREQPLYQLARQVGSVFQNPKSQFFNLDSDSELAFGLENQGVARGEILRSLDDTTNRLHLKRLRGRNIFTMSGGEKQLLAFASVYVMRPELYILDEPTANLDRETIERLHDQIAYLKRQGHTILIAEHRLYFLADLIDRAVYLRDGIVERIWSGAEFRRLTETERIALGLRTLTPTQVTLPTSRAAGEQDGLSVEGLYCRYKREPPVFQNLSFSARPGEVLAITGPLLVRPDAGECRNDPPQRPHPWCEAAATDCLLRHAGCEPSALFRQCVGRVSAGCGRALRPAHSGRSGKSTLWPSPAGRSSVWRWLPPCCPQSRCWYSTNPPVAWTMQGCRKWLAAHGNWRTRGGWFWW